MDAQRGPRGRGPAPAGRGQAGRAAVDPPAPAIPRPRGVRPRRARPVDRLPAGRAAAGSVRHRQGPEPEASECPPPRPGRRRLRRGRGRRPRAPAVPDPARHPGGGELPPRSAGRGLRPPPAHVDGLLRPGAGRPAGGPADLGHRRAGRPGPAGPGPVHPERPAVRVHDRGPGRHVAAPVGGVPGLGAVRRRRQRALSAQLEPRLPPGTGPHQPDPLHPAGEPVGRTGGAGVRPGGGADRTVQPPQPGPARRQHRRRPDRGALLPDHRAGRRRHDGRDPRNRRPARPHPPRVVGHGGRVRPLPGQRLRADPAAQPAVQHGPVRRRRAAQALRVAGHAPHGGRARGRGRPSRPRGHPGGGGWVLLRRDEPGAARGRTGDPAG